MLDFIWEFLSAILNWIGSLLGIEQGPPPATDVGTKVFFDIITGTKPVGRMVFGLYDK